VLEEVGESGFPGLDLVAGPGPDDGVKRNDMGVGQGDGNDLEPVFQLLDFVTVREDVRILAWDGKSKEQEERENKGNQFKHESDLLSCSGYIYQKIDRESI
jgi:hypothetical protein